MGSRRPQCGCDAFLRYAASPRPRCWRPARRTASTRHDGTACTRSADKSGGNSGDRRPRHSRTLLDPRTEKWIDLKVGECVTDLPPADLSRVTVTVVDCATAHLAEVYLRAPMAVDSAIANVANQDCAAGFASYTGQSVDGSLYSMTYLIDSNMDRTGGHRDAEHRYLFGPARERSAADRFRPSLT